MDRSYAAPLATARKQILKALLKGACDRIPLWFMRQAGRYLPEYRALRAKQPDFLKFCYTPELATEATMQPLHRFQPDAAILFSDILVVADALGSRVRFVEGQGPVLEAIRSGDDVDRLHVEEVPLKLSPVYEAVRQIASLLPADVALMGFAGAPWTIAFYMVEGRGGSDGRRVRAWAYQDPSSFSKLIRVISDATLVHLQEQIAAGAEAVQLFDSWAGVLPEAEFKRWVIDPTAEIVSRLRATHPGVPVIGFARAAGVMHLSYARATGVDGLGIDANVPLSWAVNSLQPLCTVQGNLDNQLLVAGGKALDTEVHRILDTLSSGPFIFNLGHGVLPETPVEHVLRVANLVRAHGGQQQ